MPTRMKLSVVTLAIAGLAACESPSTDASQAELQRDLQLASASTVNLATPKVDAALLVTMETKPQAEPRPSTSIRRGAGPRAVQSDEPTVEATPDVEVAAVEDTQETEVESIAPTPEPTNEPVAIAPRPAPVAIPASGDYGSGGGIFGGSTGRGGVVIRGGGVDGDNCELHDRARRGRGGVISSGPIYMPQPLPPRTTMDPRRVGGSRTPERPSMPSVGTSRSPIGGGMAGMRSRISR